MLLHLIKLKKSYNVKIYYRYAKNVKCGRIIDISRNGDLLFSFCARPLKIFFERTLDSNRQQQVMKSSHLKIKISIECTLAPYYSN